MTSQRADGTDGRPNAAQKSLALATLGLGVVAGGAGLAHMVAVTQVALSVRGAYDVRLGTLLVVGIAVVLSAGLMAIGAVGIWRGRPGSLLPAGLGASAMLSVSTALAPVSEGFWTGVPLFGGLLLALILVGRRGPPLGVKGRRA